jgi:hypothetical protein
MYSLCQKFYSLNENRNGSTICYKRSACFPGNMFSGIDGFQLAIIWDVNGHKLGADCDWDT